MKTSVYKIGRVYFELNMPEDMNMPENLKKFRVDVLAEYVCPAMKYILEFTDNIEELENSLLSQKIAGAEAKRENLYLFQTEQGECRRLNFHGEDSPYALTRKCSGSVTEIWFDKACADMLIYDTVFNSALALEKLMIEAEAMILHSAYICYESTAVLFSAPSETGKSTQAGLWEKYREARIINGDKSLLIRENDGWKAYGWPICGSSEICHNESFPIRAIVMLKQAKENTVYPLKGLRAFRFLMEQITLNAWDREFQMKVMDQLELLIQEIPVYCLECNISEDAVACLENMFE